MKRRECQRTGELRSAICIRAEARCRNFSRAVYNHGNPEVPSLTIDKNKQRLPASAVQSGFSLISNDKLIQIYLMMLKCRMIHERARSGGKQGGFTQKLHSVAGQEAALVGVAIDLLPGDSVSSYPFNFLPLFIKGLSLRRLFERLSVPIASTSTIAAQLELATAAAKANKTNQNNQIAVVVCTIKSTSSRAWEEALKSAGLHALPMIFVSLGTETGALSAQGKPDRGSLKTKASNFPTITVDGSDAVAVCRVASESIAHARKGDGPTLIECICSKADDPLLKMEQYLMRTGLFSEKFKGQVAARWGKKLDGAIEKTKNRSSRRQGA